MSVDRIMVGIIISSFVIVGTFSFFAFMMEANTFNKFNQTGVKATWVDAAFSELRVEAQKETPK